MSAETLLTEHGYTVKKVIGEGHLSIYYLVESNKYQTTFVAKIYNIIDENKREEKINAYNNEVKVLPTLQHKNIISIYDYFKNDGFLILILSCCMRGNLNNYIKAHYPLSETDLLKLTSQMVSAVANCHQFNVVNLNLQLSSFLLHEKLLLKLTDFANAVMKDEPLPQNFAKITPLQYNPPEVLLKHPVDLQKVDMWQLGVSLYLLANGRMPCDCESEEEMRNNIIKCNFSIENELPSSILLAINRCLVADPKERADISEIKECFRPFETPVQRPQSLAMGRNKLVAQTFSTVRNMSYRHHNNN